MITLIPLTWAAHVALSRMEDNVSDQPSLLLNTTILIRLQRHHKEDVMVGTLIGIAAALICYTIFWPSPFSAKNLQVETAGQPRYLYNVTGNSQRVEFELAPMDDEADRV